LFEFFVNAGVVASKDAHTNYCDGNRIIWLQGNSLRAGCLREPCIVNGKGRDLVIWRLSDWAIGTLSLIGGCNDSITRSLNHSLLAAFFRIAIWPAW
jgi:hypothetical protein